MRRRSIAAMLSATALLGLGACASAPALPPAAGYGADPVLPAPSGGLLPVVRIAPAVGWAMGEAPTPAPGLRVQAFARGLDHPRWLYRLPNGDVLVAESDAPPKPEDKRGGLIGWVRDRIMERAGSGLPSADRITLLRDGDGDGEAEVRSVFLDGLRSPFGMALVGDRLFVANADAVVVAPYRTGQTRIETAPALFAPLPAGRNHHWTKSLVASADGRSLYVGVGSNSNIGENGLDEEVGRAAVHQIDVATGRSRIFASGLRNPVGLAFNPDSGALWVAVNERDEIGPDLVPDYMTALSDGAFYGWPWSWFGQTVDARVTPANPQAVARAVRPDYALGAHTASLGLDFYDADLMPRLRGAAIVGQHGSWNRSPPVGYRVIAVPFQAGRPAGEPHELLTGFRDAQGRARGRPVGVEVDRLGAILVADDVGGVVWRVSPAT